MITGKRLAALLVATGLLFGIGCENMGSREQGTYERGRLGEEETQSSPGMGQTEQPGAVSPMEEEDRTLGTPGSPSSPGSGQQSGAQTPGSQTNP